MVFAIFETCSIVQFFIDDFPGETNMEMKKMLQESR